jgi:hypothetical protein
MGEFNDINKNLKDLQLNFIRLNDQNKKIWELKINNIEDAKIFFSNNQILYEREYLEAKDDFVFIIENESKYYVSKFFITNLDVIIFSPFISDEFNYSLGNKINKIIYSFVKSLDFNIRINTIPRVNTLTENFKILFSSIFKIESSYDMYVDLTLSDNELWKSLRKSYKSLINSTTKQLIFKNDINENDFFLCKNFHHLIAGRKTRNDETWKLQYDSIQKGESKIFMAFDSEKKLLGFSLFQIGNNTVSYSVGVYDREKFKNLAISHALIWKSILHFKESHKLLYLGDSSYKKEIHDKKLKDINNFKMGFCNKIQINSFLV